MSADYLFKINDWNSDGFDDVALRRREITELAERRQDVDDSTIIYTAENGTLFGHAITEPKKREEVNAELCSDSKLTFCKQSK